MRSRCSSCRLSVRSSWRPLRCDSVGRAARSCGSAVGYCSHWAYFRSPVTRTRAGWDAVAWGAAFLLGAAIGLHLSDGRGRGVRAPRSATRMWRGCTGAVSALRPGRDPDDLIVLCERRIGRPVNVASQFRVKTPSGPRTHVLAVAAGCVWWLELQPWRDTIGCILLYRPLDGLAAHSERVRPGRYQLELSWPASGELFVGRLHGAGADRFAGQLAAEQFARASASASAREEEC